MRYFLILSFLTLLISCKDELAVSYTPPPLSDSLFVKVLGEIHLVDALSKQKVTADNRMLETKYSQFKGVLEKHDVSQAEFDTTLTYYSKHPEHFKEIYNQIIDSYKQMEIELYENNSTDSLE